MPPGGGCGGGCGGRGEGGASSQAAVRAATGIPCPYLCLVQAYIPLFNPETSILIQKRHPDTGNPNSETPGDSKNAFLHCRYVFFMSVCSL